jgi:hypothetical protein
VLKSGKPLLERLAKPPISPRLLILATRLYCDALQSTGRKNEAAQVRRAMEDKLDKRNNP